jgi:hypothetical protein
MQWQQPDCGCSMDVCGGEDGTGLCCHSSCCARAPSLDCSMLAFSEFVRLFLQFFEPLRKPYRDMSLVLNTRMPIVPRLKCSPLFVKSLTGPSDAFGCYFKSCCWQ